jgi:hypothetical protein
MHGCSHALTTEAARPRTWAWNPLSISCEDEHDLENEHDLVLVRARETQITTTTQELVPRRCPR